MNRRTKLTASLLGLLIMFGPALGWTQEEPAKEVTGDDLKKILDGLGRKYAVKDGDFLLKEAKPGPDKADYRLILYSFKKGKAVVVSCNGFQRGDDIFRLKSVLSSDEKGVEELLERINQWNVNKALSRAILTQGADKLGKKIHYARLEADIAWETGVTDKKVDHLMKQFVKSLGEFETFLK